MMRVVIVENTAENVNTLKDSVHALLPNALVKGFTDGNEAEKWCNEHKSEISLFFGNWWGTMEEFSTIEGAAVWKYIDWPQKPVVICVGDEERFAGWSVKEGADAFILRPVTVEKLRDIIEKSEL